jgi:hypothetical protein
MFHTDISILYTWQGSRIFTKWIIAGNFQIYSFLIIVLFLILSVPFQNMWALPIIEGFISYLCIIYSSILYFPVFRYSVTEISALCILSLSLNHLMHKIIDRVRCIYTATTS